MSDRLVLLLGRGVIGDTCRRVEWSCGLRRGMGASVSVDEIISLGGAVQW